VSLPAPDTGKARIDGTLALWPKAQGAGAAWLARRQEDAGHSSAEVDVVILFYRLPASFDAFRHVFLRSEAPTQPTACFFSWTIGGLVFFFSMRRGYVLFGVWSTRKIVMNNSGCIVAGWCGCWCCRLGYDLNSPSLSASIAKRVDTKKIESINAPCMFLVLLCHPASFPTECSGRSPTQGLLCATNIGPSRWPRHGSIGGDRAPRSRVCASMIFEAPYFLFQQFVPSGKLVIKLLVEEPGPISLVPACLPTRANANFFDYFTI